ncbi:unnamed protein product [Closterium sp. NIES-54]
MAWAMMAWHAQYMEYSPQTEPVAGDSSSHLHPDPSSSSNSAGAAVGSGGGGEEGRRGFFVEVWDVSGSEQYKSSRSLFYDQINGVIFVHDLSRKKSRVAALQWMDELVRSGTFSAPSHSMSREGQLPVPLLVIGNKDDLRDKDPVLQGQVKLLRAARSSRTLEYAMRHAKTVVERYGLRSFGRRKRGELPEYIRNPRGAGLIACAKQGRLDLAAVEAFFLQLIKRRYFTEQLTALPSPSRSWSQPFLYVEGMEGELNADALLLPSSSARTGGEQQGARGGGEGAVAGLYRFNSLRGSDTRWVGLLRRPCLPAQAESRGRVGEQGLLQGSIASTASEALTPGGALEGGF